MVLFLVSLSLVRYFSFSTTIVLNNEIVSVEKIEDKFYILCDNGMKYTSNSLIIATGGISYSGTGLLAFLHKRQSFRVVCFLI